MKLISLDNGNTYLEAHEAVEEINQKNLWDFIIDIMDDEAREKVHAEFAPCTEKEFLERYLEIAPDHLVIG